MYKKVGFSKVGVHTQSPPESVFRRRERARVNTGEVCMALRSYALSLSPYSHTPSSRTCLDGARSRCLQMHDSGMILRSTNNGKTDDADTPIR